MARCESPIFGGKASGAITGHDPTRHGDPTTVILCKHNPGRDPISLNLSAPKTLTFLIAAALIAFGIIAEFTSILDVSGDTAVLALAGGGLLLGVGCLFKGI